MCKDTYYLLVYNHFSEHWTMLHPFVRNPREVGGGIVFLCQSKVSLLLQDNRKRICLSAWCRVWFTHLLQQKHKSHTAVKPIQLKLEIIKTIGWWQTLLPCTALLKGEHTQLKGTFLAEQPRWVNLIRTHRDYYVMWIWILLQKLSSNKYCGVVSQPFFFALVALWLWWLCKEIKELMGK